MDECKPLVGGGGDGGGGGGGMGGGKRRARGGIGGSGPGAGGGGSGSSGVGGGSPRTSSGDGARAFSFVGTAEYMAPEIVTRCGHGREAGAYTQLEQLQDTFMSLSWVTQWTEELKLS